MARSFAIRRKKMGGLISTFFFAFLFFYFTYHMISGRNGVITMLQLEKQLENATIRLDETQLEKMDLEHRVGMISSQIDLDLLEEQARRLLNYSHPDEVMIVIPKEDQKLYFEAQPTETPAQ